MFEGLQQELKIRRYSQKTAKNYLHYNQKFLLFCKKEIDEVTTSDIRNYLEYLADKDSSASTMRAAYNALQFFYRDVLNTRLMENIKIPKNDYKVTVGLTKEEVNQLVNAINNPKHKLLLELIYASGVRAQEAVKIKIKDILAKEKVVVIRAGKGRRDRKTILSDKFVNSFKEQNDANAYLFPGRNGPLTTRSVQQIIKQAAKKAGITKRVYPHLLRHAFATHLFQNDVKTEHIQRLLGHKDKKTTEGYIQTQSKEALNIKSPHDYV